MVFRTNQAILLLFLASNSIWICNWFPNVKAKSSMSHPEIFHQVTILENFTQFCWYFCCSRQSHSFKKLLVMPYLLYYVGLKLFWTCPNQWFGHVRNVLDRQDRARRFGNDCEKLFLVWFITFYSLDLSKDMALESNFKLFVGQKFLNGQHLSNYLQASVEVKITLFFINT